MKRVVFFLIVVLLVYGNIFAQTGEETTVPGSTNDTDNLTVKLKINPVNDVEWFMTDISKVSEWEASSDKSDEDEKEFGTDGNPITVYPSILTNQSTSVTIRIKGTALVNGNSTIDLIASSSDSGAVEGHKTVTWTATAANDTDYIEFKEPTSETYEKRVYSPELTLSLPSDWQSKTGYTDPYVANLTLEYISQ